MANNALNSDGLLYLWQKIKNLFALKSDAVKSITRSGTTFTATKADGTTFTFTQQDNTVAKTTTTPKMNGTSAIGSETKYAAGDHVHPVDTSRVPVTRKINGHALSDDVTLYGTDFCLEGGSADKTSLSEYIVETIEAVARKVDKVTGKGLSTNDYTTAEKNKLAGIDVFTGATTSANGKQGLVPAPVKLDSNGYVSVLTDAGGWSVLSADDITTEDESISVQSTLNNKVDKISGKGLSTNDYTSAEKTKLAGIATGAEVNVQSDWNVTTTTDDAYIKNKPSLGTAAAKAVDTSIAAGSTSTNLPTTAAVESRIAAAIDAAKVGAAAFQGTVTTSGTTDGMAGKTGYKKGYYWVVQTAGTYAGQTCEAGDMIFCISDYASSYKAADFSVVQNNLTFITNAEIDTILAS